MVGRQGLPLERDHDMTRVAERGLRSYVSEPNRGRRKWKGKRDAQKATYDNRGRIRGERGERLLRKRGEKLERSSLPRRAPQSEFLGTFPKFLRFVANRLAAPSCFLLLLSSCSYFTVKGPPAYIPPNDPVPIGACTLESKAPIADGIVAGFLTFNLVESFWLSDDEVRDKRSVSKRFYIMESIVIIGTFAHSSYTGRKRIKKCRIRTFQKKVQKVTESNPTMLWYSPEP